MREYRARSAEHAAIVIALDEQAPPPDALLAYFEQEAAEGRRFRPDETIEFGWTFLLLKKGEGATLEVWEPSPDSMPIKWRRGASNAIQHLTLQLAVCKELGCQPQFPSLRDAGIISPEFLTSSEFRMSRDDPSENDSGWVFSTPGYADDEGEYRSLFEISLHQSDVIPFLALPSGAVVTKTKDGIAVELAGVEVSWQSNGSLKKLMTP